ncbi:MAG: hypothetical protein UW43_C0001G0028 [Candidatus Yanofskybacteria bacterium GW2011_GWA1_44_21]|uniref:Uncharacterized protein n=2 Tax=Candidatus Yanofskyibacteriota TaxID=1752733 RepID=A0A1F8H0D4_9BACT|nr:MAG: hypothetical protein UW14_C0006G0020 [Candidatus Yanofskybacteria bacterium GW2011_GWA2_44_10]KKT50863.1 MAG: hypothetical protein UW43_C0001G0028 [Candidatus Yanofskybacteria bacterium GW2011_GWA1_44_21]KKT90435.1 MAG: hypothetical protein UW90_C0001G0023 [Candidatus Yanofskybacteria bacterium GW2011_GWB1_45_11]OGN02283.1 MAG: hypothetical protein A2657_00850 [Candidatus Yanofskybacteria bacterium RIFCSPHIGHO2_01_FULL_44_110b]OGN14241.1 MAG: hypothetical protein A3C01_01440 [Candidatus
MKKYIIGTLALASGFALFWIWLGGVGIEIKTAGVRLPFSLADIGPKLIELGVIDENKYSSPYLTRQYAPLEISSENSRDILNILWGFGLANKNEILETGPMADPKYGGPEGFASTGGWTIGTNHPMSHYSKHDIVTLNAQQQKLVNSVSKRIFRPCCPNPAYFPDCNHGMAMLGLLELMAHNGLDEKNMEQYAHKVNEMWFPELRQNSSCAV